MVTLRLVTRTFTAPLLQEVRRIHCVELLIRRHIGPGLRRSGIECWGFSVTAWLCLRFQRLDLLYIHLSYHLVPSASL